MRPPAAAVCYNIRMRLLLAVLLLLLATVADARGFDVTGQVLGADHSDGGWILLAGNESPKVFALEGKAAPDCHSGDIIHALGRLDTGPKGNLLALATNVVVIGRKPLPDAVEITASRINDTNLLYRCVRMRGVVVSVVRDDTNTSWNQITLRTTDGKICAVTEDTANPYAEL